MKKLFFFIYCSLAFTAQAQFDAAKYFSDSVSFSYQECRASIVRKKEVMTCSNYKFFNRIIGTQFTTTQIMYWPNKTIVNEGRTEYDGGTFSSIDFNRSTIKPLYQYNTVTTPEQVYVLTLKGKDPQHWFARVSKYFPLKAIEEIRLYFPSINAAQETKDYLKLMRDIFQGGAKRGEGLTLQILPAAKCFEKQQRYVNEKFGYTLCLDGEEKAEEKTFAKFNHKYLTEFTTITGYSDLPFYIFPVDYKRQNDSLAIFKNYEDEFFQRLGTASIVKKELDKNIYTPTKDRNKPASYFRRYFITLSSGDEAVICFNYLLQGNSMFDALCIGYMAPTTLIGAGYAFRSAALESQCVLLSFK